MEEDHDEEAANDGGIVSVHGGAFGRYFETLRKSRGFSREEHYELTEAERNSMAFHDGRREGKLEGKLEGLRELVLTILELRQLPANAPALRRIHACEDVDQLEEWADRAKRANELADVFGDDLG